MTQVMGEVLPQYVIDQLQLLRTAKETGTILLHLKDGEIRDADFQPPKRKFRLANKVCEPIA